MSDVIPQFQIQMESNISGENIKDRPSVSVVIPTYGDEPALPETIEEVLAVFPGASRNTLEIIIVHTPQGDSEEKAMDISARFSPFVRVVTEKRKGYGIAYMKGFQAARNEIIVTLDADLTYPAHDIPRMIDVLVNNDIEFINTDRLKSFEDGAFHWSHGVGNRFLTILMNMLFMTDFNDSQSGMWVFRREAWSKLNCVGRHWEFSAEIKIEAARKNLRRREIPIHYRRRTEGESTNSVIEGVKIAMFLVAKRLGLGRNFAHLRV